MPKHYVRDTSLHIVLSALGVGANYLINGNWMPGLVVGILAAAMITGMLRLRDDKTAVKAKAAQVPGAATPTTQPTEQAGTQTTDQTETPNAN